MKAIGIILAGGNNRRMSDLTTGRAIAAMPMAGNYRAIDFTLTNMADSRIQKVAVLMQYNSVSLNEHLSSSKWWDFGRKQGGLFVYTPRITPENSNWYRGTLDAMHQNIHFLKESHEPYVVIVSGDGIYRMDYNKALDSHIRNRADITVVTTTMQDWDDPGRFGQVITDEDGRIVDFDEKPMVARTNEINCGIYVIRRRLLIELLETCIQEDRFDFVRDVIIRYRNLKRIYSYHLDSYWTNIASVRAYYRTNMDFLKPEIRKLFFRTGNGILTRVNDFPPAKYNPGCQVRNSLVASGSIIEGTVENSIIFRKCFVGRGAVIKNSIVLNDVYIGENAVLENCIVESHGTIDANSTYSGDPENIRVILEKNSRYAL